MPTGPVGSAHLDCVWVGMIGDDDGFTDRVLPDACIDVIWDGIDLFVAGPDTGPVIRVDLPGSFFAGVRFRPGHAPAFLGLPAAELRDQRVSVRDLWGAPFAAELEDDISWRAPGDAARRLEQRITALAVGNEATAAIDAVRASVLSTDVGSLANELGVTARTLHRRCEHAFGYGPKTLQRVLRFRKFLSLAERSPAKGLAHLAADAGYADQPHLTRESMRLSGLAPRELLSSRGVRFVQYCD